MAAGPTYDIIENLDSLEVLLEDAIDEIDDMSEPLTESAELVQTLVLSNFASKGGLTADSVWEDLKPQYAEWKMQNWGGQGEADLVLTHDLIDAADDVSAIVVLGPNEVSYIIDDEKASWHESGRERSKGGRLPARPIIPEDRYLEEPIGEIIQNWIEDVLDQ